MRQALRADPRVLLMGEDIGRYGGCYAVTKGLLEEFGPSESATRRCRRSAFVGAGIGAAMGGMRPIVEIMTVNFSLLALDQIVNNAATHAAHVRRAVRRTRGDPHRHRRRPAASPRNIRTAWRDGTPISPACASSRRRRSRTRAFMLARR